ncbi:MAG: DUF952 domain-containing protein [Actinomycetota bacterium]|nr:DUF952 domain-containing protein [Actinomycetota bacterium]
MDPLFHIVDFRRWSAAIAAGQYHAETLATEGFVHCSFRDQVGGTLARHYPQVPGLIVVELDAARIDAPVVVEDTTGGGVRFPHIYGAIPTAAAVATHEVTDFDRDRH